MRSLSGLNTAFLILLVAWSAVIALIALWHDSHNRRAVMELATTEARSSYKRDIAYRHWAARAGGVYVPVSVMPPNPYLKLPEREITTPSGRELTLVNPAYMTRSVYDNAAEQNRFYGRITRLEPINPDNAPDEWEREALLALQSGGAEVSALGEINGVPHLRFMGALQGDKACLGCHVTQVQVGHLVGGISVAAPWEPYRENLAGQLQTLVLGYGFLWVLGLGGLWDTRRRLLRALKNEEQTQKLLADREHLLLQQARVAAMGEMTSAIAHHWRQPLTVILLMVQNAEEMYKSGELNDAYMAHTAQRVKELVSELSETIEVLRGMNTQSGELVFTCTCEQVGKVVHLMRPQLSAHRIAVDYLQPKTDEGGANAGLRIYPSALRQAVVNLLLNARDAILLRRQREGNGSMEGKIRIEIVRNAHDEQIIISDNGSGFTPQALERAFEPFFTTKETGRGQGVISGTGLGLYIVKLVVEEQMQGTITLANGEEGAIVTITLPRLGNA
ncbi:MAG: ATP-binding protein [Campylobacterales bacterium]